MSRTPERQRQVERLYHAALELDVGHRHAFLLVSSAGDEELCREVETLLLQSDAPTLQADGSRDSGRLEAGSRLGPTRF